MHAKIYSDIHLHTSFSGDSETPMEDMIQSGIERGLRQMCFTEHLDMDYPLHPEDPVDFSLDEDSYKRAFMEMKEKYRGQIELLFGIELGLQPHLKALCSALVKKHPFDFVIGSSHTADGEDPYYAESFFRGITETEGCRKYFSSVLENIRLFSREIDAYGHIDYVIRYTPGKDKSSIYEACQDILDEILQALIEEEIALEVNTGGLKYGLGQPNPRWDLIKKYRRMGGELLTIGSDAHSPEYLAYEFARIADFLADCGFTHYTIFRDRKPVFLPLR